MSASRLGASLRALSERTVAAQSGGGPLLATVLDLDPWTLEPHDSADILDAEDITLGSWVLTYDAMIGVTVGDTVLVAEMEDGDYLVIDVISDNAVLGDAAPKRFAFFMGG